mgnify:CR=1 FL=1
MADVKLTSIALEKVADRLKELSEANAYISTMAYAGEVNSVSGCGCKNGCEGGCTSW